MPQVKSVKSLAVICIDSILENQEIFCKRFKIGELEHCMDALDSDEPPVNPFDELPAELLEELIKLLRDKQTSEINNPYRCFYKITPFLKLLMTPRLHTLDLTLIEEGSDISDVLYLAAIRCLHLQTLRLNFSSHHCVKRLIPKFTKLRILEISLPEKSDECFELIGRHCPNLRYLYCEAGKLTDDQLPPTDDGIRKLCVDGYCKSIRKLSLSGCKKITTKGIQMALDNLPHLTILRHESLVECLAEIAQAAINQKSKLPRYSLSVLYILNYTIYKNGSLQKSVLLCPHVTKVYLSMFRKDRLKDTDLLSLLSLEKIFTLKITFAEFEYVNSTEIRIDRLTFDNVVPLLNKFGWCLKKIDFRNFYFVDIPTIIKFCPNLESLTISNCKTNQSTETTVDMPILQHLKRLLIFSYPTISSESVFALLSCPSLSEICLSDCNVLTDNVLQRAANLHSFRNLEYLHLSCYSVTKNGIDIFLRESNPLRRIVLHWNRVFTREDVNDWNDNSIWIKKNWHFKMYLHRCHYTVCLGGAKITWGGVI